jgi:DNA-binding transcriptional LysR family regulator
VVREASNGQTAWEVTGPAGLSHIVVDPVLRLSSLVAIRDAVRTGVGAGRLPLSLVSHDLAAGKLVHWGDVVGSDIALWTLYPSRRLLSARVSAFLGYLREAFPRGTPDELAACIAG